MNDKQVSKFMSYVLRHHPEEVGLTLDENGWVDILPFFYALVGRFPGLQIEDIMRIVEQSDKQRFQLVSDNMASYRIRANQGHSIKVDLALEAKTPPDVLYHGTKREFVASIRNTGLNKGSRHHVHLSADTGTAEIVASRRSGESVILVINALAMKDTHEFYLTENGVWLTDHVPAEFISGF